MAASKPSHSDLTECPVCTDQYKDPRLLSCGHHFCLVCLQKIAEDSDVIICPTCRFQSLKPTESLTKYKMNEFKVTANVFTFKDEFTKKLCSSCLESMGSMSCMDCRMVFCRSCTENHSILEKSRGHRLYTVSSYQFCKKHPDIFIVSVCEDCSVGCCFCCMTEHKGHNLYDIKSAAEDARKTIAWRAKNLEPVEKAEQFLKDIREKSKNLESLQKEFQTSVTNSRQRLVDLIKDLDSVQKKTEDTIKAERKRLGLLEWDLEQFIDSKKKMTETLKNLQENLSDADVVFRSKDYPTYTSSSCFSLLDTGMVKIPDISAMKDAAGFIQDLRAFINVDFTTVVLVGMPLKNLVKDTKPIVRSVKQGILGMMCHPVTNHLVLRTNSTTAPIQIISKDGELVEIIGQNVPYICSDSTSMKGIAYDAKRGSYVLPMCDGKIVTISDNNNIGTSIQPSIFALLIGIAVNPEQDCYYVTDSKTKNVHIIDPNKKKVERNFYGGRNCTENPLNIICAADKSTGQQQLIIGFREHNIVQVCNMYGQVLHSYDTTLGKIDAVARPRGICFDPDGRILVCDKDNSRIVAFWTEDGLARNEILIDKEQLGKETPRYIAIDPESRLLYVGFLDGIIYKFKEQTQETV